jgi:16S rRNA (cytidine1402-2'-O)-methyltransferase
MLALAASGLNGQDFAFVGYVPQDAGLRSQRIQALEALALKSGQTQLIIETPYRNAALLGSLIQTLKSETRMAVACDMGLPTSDTISAPVREWKATPAWSQRIGNNRPAVFMLGR